MPELNDVVKTEATTGTVVEATVVQEVKPEVLPETPPEAKLPETPVVAGTTVAEPEKKKAKKAKVKKEVKEPKTPKEKKEPKEPKFQRPPLEQIVKDFETHLTSQKIRDQKIEKLGYKCGKMIFGLPNADGKDFRIVAYKARKKTKTVAGKSRCVFYFGTTSKVDFPGVNTSNFGKCSVQSPKPVELKLDKVSYTEVFEKNVDKVIKTLKDLVKVTIEQKTEQWDKRKKEKKEVKE